MTVVVLLIIFGIAVCGTIGTYGVLIYKNSRNSTINETEVANLQPNITEIIDLQLNITEIVNITNETKEPEEPLAMVLITT
jgi:hypothetical protein